MHPGGVSDWVVHSHHAVLVDLSSGFGFLAQSVANLFTHVDVVALAHSCTSIHLATADALTSTVLNLVVFCLQTVTVDGDFLVSPADWLDISLTIFTTVDIGQVVLGFVAFGTQTGSETLDEVAAEANARTRGCATVSLRRGTALLAALLAWLVLVEVDFAFDALLFILTAKVL